MQCGAALICILVLGVVRLTVITISLHTIGILFRFERIFAFSILFLVGRLQLLNPSQKYMSETQPFICNVAPLKNNFEASTFNLSFGVDVRLG